MKQNLLKQKVLIKNHSGSPSYKGKKNAIEDKLPFVVEKEKEKLRWDWNDLRGN